MKQKQKPFPRYGWLGIAIMIISETLLFNGSKFVATWLTPLMWTGYILTVDGLVFKLKGRSWLKNRLREVPFLILISVGVWILFEVYNFHLKNWQYVGLPANIFIRDIGFFWSFSTIMPGIFETSELLHAIFKKNTLSENSPPPDPRLNGMDWFWVSIGLLMVIVPLLLKEELASYLFALVWIGFIPLLDPINKRLGAPTLSSYWRRSKKSILIIILVAGFICGLLWETWNFQAYLSDGAFWVYTFPQPLRILGLHYGKMPLLGLLGFPPFALELFVFYQFFRKCFKGDQIFGAASGMIT
jgi:hypothetical protein